MGKPKCMYCKENGIKNEKVFIQVEDVELGRGWVCKECFLQAQQEKDEHYEELVKENEILESKLSKIKENDVFATAEETREAFLSKHLQLPKALQIDEVAHAFFNSSRVESWEILGEEYAGHKIGAIYSFVLGLIEKHIGESMCIKSEQIISKGEV